MPWPRFSRRQLYSDLSAEIRQHLEEATEELVASGMAREEAEGMARRTFGNVTLLEQRGREAWQWPTVESTLRDIRFAIRQIRKSPAFAATFVLTLALGVGATVAVYGLVDAVLLRPLQFKNEKRLVQVFEERPELGLSKEPAAPANYLDWKRRNHVFADMAAASGDIFTVTGNGRPLEVETTHISANLLPLLGVTPLLGHNFTQDDDKPGNAVALISAGLWRQRYGSDPAVVGKTIRLNGVPYRIAGVMPFGFTFQERSEVWVPLALDTGRQLSRDNHFLLVYGLLRPGISIPAAQREMADISRQLEEEYPATNRRLGASVVPLREQLLGGSRLAIFILAAGVCTMLLITLTNLAGLMIARGATRSQEMAVRVALGASRLALLRQNMAESFTLSLGGGLLGILLAFAAIPILRHFVPTTIASWAQPEINWRVMLFTLVITTLSALTFGVAGQSLIATRLHQALSQGTRTATEATQHLRSALVMGEVALATVILAATGLLGESFWKLAHTDLGFEPKSVLTLRTALPVSEQTPFREFSAREHFYKSVLDRVEQLPGVKAAGYTTFLPLTNPGGSSEILIEGAPPLPVGKTNDAVQRVITPDYFHALAIPLIAGRTFTEGDGQNPTPLVVINQKMARQYWPGGDAIGRRIRHDDPGSPWMTVIGVVGDVHQRDVETPSVAEMYYSYEQNLSIVAGYFTPRDLAIRVSGDPLNYANAVERAIWSVAPEQAISSVQSMQHLVDARLQTYNLEAKLFTFFGGISLLLSALGIYGLMSYSVVLRTQEIGVRMALGAQRQQVLRGFLAKALRLFLIGLVLGIPCSIAAARFLGGVLYGVSGMAWGAAVLPLLLLATSVVLAAYIPARRAAALDPMKALRAE